MKRRGGFTAAELMVVMAMIGFATAILSVAFHGANGRARTSSCLSNVCQLGLSARMYMQDNDGWMPSPPPAPQPGPGQFAPGEPPMDPALGGLQMPDGPQIGGLEACWPLMVYVKNSQVFSCPDAPDREVSPEYDVSPDVSSNRRSGSQDWFQVDYIFNLSARSDDPPTTILVSDDVPDRHPGRTWNAVRVDGAGVRMRADRWDEFWASGPDDWMTEEGMMGDEPPAFY